jgi:hypothetical protein
MLATAHRQLSPFGHALRFVVRNAPALPCATRSFDPIIANHMLYHMQELWRYVPVQCLLLRGTSGALSQSF